MTTWLTRILETKADEVAVLRKEEPEKRYLEVRGDLPAPHDFRSAITSRDGGLNLIAEIKKASPSRGVLVEDFQPLEIAGRYADSGASAFSVLTDRHYFQGSPEYLKEIRNAFSIPVLRKEFIIDDSQIYESRLMGADAALLIVAALDPSQLKDYLQLFNELGLDAIVEVHDRLELDIALEQGSRIVGVNNRDLRDFSVDLKTSVSLKQQMPSDIVAVAESGMKRREDILMMQEAGFDAVLIGEGLLVSEELRQFTWG